MRIYLDTMIWIYAWEGHPQFGALAQGWLSRIRAGGHTLLTSHFLLAELLVAPTKRNDTFTVASYRLALTASSGELILFTENVATRFALVRAQFRTKAADSIHLALAASAEADLFVTGDTRLTRLTVPGVGRVVNLGEQFT